jgi:hypothetical protein
MAYRDRVGVVAYGRTIYVAGTKDPGDLITDMLLLFKSERFTDRYTRAVELARTGKYGRIVGHSLGGVVALSVADDVGGVQVRTYGAPVIRRAPKVGEQRLRDAADPFSFFDRHATTFRGYLPHSLGRVTRPIY